MLQALDTLYKLSYLLHIAVITDLDTESHISIPSLLLYDQQIEAVGWFR